MIEGIQGITKYLPGASSSFAWIEYDFHSDFTTSLRTLRAAVNQKSSAPRAGDTPLSPRLQACSGSGT